MIKKYNKTDTKKYNVDFFNLAIFVEDEPVKLNEKIYYKKYKITAKKFNNNFYNWAIFIKDEPVIIRFIEEDIPRFKKLAYEIYILGENK